MVDANIPDIKIQPGEAVFKVQQRFHLEETEEGAIKLFEQLIADSVNAVFPVVIDMVHGFMQQWKS